MGTTHVSTRIAYTHLYLPSHLTIHVHCISITQNLIFIFSMYKGGVGLIKKESCFWNQRTKEGKTSHSDTNHKPKCVYPCHSVSSSNMVCEQNHDQYSLTTFRKFIINSVLIIIHGLKTVMLEPRCIIPEALYCFFFFSESDVNSNVTPFIQQQE